MEDGIIPDMILCRGRDTLDDVRKSKIESYVGIKKEYIISVPDVSCIYNVPNLLEEQLVGFKIFGKLNVTPKLKPDWTYWNSYVNNMQNASDIINIGIVCKYLNTGKYQLVDSYLSVSEAIKHACAHLDVYPNIVWLDGNSINDTNIHQIILENDINGLIVPGGFGSSGVEGKISAIKYCRTCDLPFLGLCYGMQLAVVEYARNECGLEGAHTTEIDPNTPHPVIIMLADKKDKQIGGTMRLGEYTSNLQKESKVRSIYNSDVATERHRHRYEVSPEYVTILEQNGMVFSGKQNNLVEFLEIPSNDFFVATQSHPELTSSLVNPNPLFLEFIKQTKIKIDYNQH
jgi:CTP synthase